MSLVAFRHRNHPHQLRVRGADDDIDDRRTPASIFDPLHEEHRFTLDAAASRANAKLPAFFDRRADGLAQSWEGHVVWCNPPYSNLYAWVSKARREISASCLKVVLLLPANRTEQRWWQELIEPVRDRIGTGVTTRNLPGRPRFGSASNPTGSHIRGPEPKRADGSRIRKTSSPFGVVVVVFERAEAARKGE